MPAKCRTNSALPKRNRAVSSIAQFGSPSLRDCASLLSIEPFKYGKLQAKVLERGTAWLDTGTFDSLNSASSFIQIIEERQGQKVSCLEEVAWRNGWI